MLMTKLEAPIQINGKFLLYLVHSKHSLIKSYVWKAKAYIMHLPIFIAQG